MIRVSPNIRVIFIYKKITSRKLWEQISRKNVSQPNNPPKTVYKRNVIGYYPFNFEAYASPDRLQFCL